MSSLRAVKANTVVKLDKPEAFTPGGIALPDRAQGKTDLRRGRVVSVGPERDDLKPGDHVVVNWAGHVVIVAGVEYEIFARDNVLAVLGD